MLSEVLPGLLWIGGERDLDPKALLAFEAVASIGSVQRSDWIIAHGVDYLWLGQMDAMTTTRERVDKFLRFMGAHTGPVLIHCQMGLSRAPCFAMLWMVENGHCDTLEEAEQRICAVRPQINPHPVLFDSIREHLTERP